MVPQHGIRLQIPGKQTNKQTWFGSSKDVWRRSELDGGQHCAPRTVSSWGWLWYGAEVFLHAAAQALSLLSSTGPEGFWELESPHVSDPPLHILCPLPSTCPVYIATPLHRDRSSFPIQKSPEVILSHLHFTSREPIQKLRIEKLRL